MKKLYILLILMLSLLLNGCLEKDNNSESLTLIEAIHLANSDALTWNQEAELINATSVDNDEEITGFDGKRRYWNVIFGLTNSKDMLLVNIKNGEVNEHIEIPEEGPENYFITDLTKIKYDSPELLKKAKEISDLYPGDWFAKGYNFGITKDPEEGSILIKIIGWDKELKNMKYLLFNAETGEFHSELKREQYQ